LFATNRKCFQLPARKLAENESISQTMARRRKIKRGLIGSGVFAETQFERELDVFRTEVETTVQYFYGYLAIHAAAGEARVVHHLLNSAPLFWNTNLGALQTATFVTLGRIFDQNSAHNVSRLLRIAQDNPGIFSKAALGRRKLGTNATPPSWLSDYLKDAHVPTAADFQRLQRYVSKQRKIYTAKYQPLRHKVFAHREISDAAAVSALFAQTNIREMQRMLGLLMSLYEALWQLFVNGRKPVLRARRYSVKQMRKRPSKNVGGSAVHERIVHEAGQFLSAAAIDRKNYLKSLG
jgi:hypothetical protein